MRGALTAAIYKKILRVTPTAFNRAGGAGKIQTIISIDVSKVLVIITFFNVLWASPLQLIVGLTFIYFQVGIAAFVGIGAVVILTPLQNLFARKAYDLRKRLIRYVDRRLQATHDTIHGIKVIKMYGWTKAFEKKLIAIRNLELKKVFRLSLWSGLSGSFLTISFTVMLLVTFATYIGLGNNLTAHVAFATMTTFGLLQGPLAMFPTIFIAAAESGVSFDRVLAFLYEEEGQSQQVTGLSRLREPTEEGEDVIVIENGMFVWARWIEVQIIERRLAMRKAHLAQQEKERLEHEQQVDPRLEEQQKAVTVVPEEQPMVASEAGDVPGEQPPMIPEAIPQEGDAARPADDMPPPAAVSSEEDLDDLAFGEGHRTDEIDSDAGEELGEAPLDDAEGQPGGGLLADQQQPQEPEQQPQEPEQQPQEPEQQPQEPEQQPQEGATPTADVIEARARAADAASSQAKMRAGLIPRRQGLFALRDINLKIKKGELILIFGRVGSGKSTLLQALLGELACARGSIVTRSERISYCAQEAFIVNATIRNNIVWGGEYDDLRYKRIIQACNLTDDLDLLPAGDQTEIGEKGVNLSGGQKARVSLCRAVYRRSELCLLDDVLSAVDPPVSKYIMDHCFLGLLRERTVILATSQIQYGCFADRIVFMDSGRILDVGTHEELLERLPLYEEAITKHVGTEVNDEEQEAEEDVDLKDHEKDGDGKLIDDEELSTGKLRWSTVMLYVNALGGKYVALMLVMLIVITQGLNRASTFWLTFLVDGDGKNRQSGLEDSYLIGYAVIVIGLVVLSLVNLVVFEFAAQRAAKRIYRQILLGTLAAPMSFFDTTPAGRILSRFSNDVGEIDSTVPALLRGFISSVVGLFTLIVSVMVVFPLYATVFVPMFFVFYFVQQYYRRSARELKRFDSINRSPVFAQLSETFGGLQSIRAYESEEIFTDYLLRRMDASNRCFYVLSAAQRWLELRLGLLGGIVIAAAGMFAILSRGTVSGVLTGLVLSYSIQLPGAFNSLLSIAASTEIAMNAVERCQHYAQELPAEQQVVEVDGRKRYRKKELVNWATRGDVEFHSVSVRYREGLPLVLENINFKIASGSKVGLVGRTGSGKSTIMLLFFRILELADGVITIDGKEIQRIPLRTLRRKIAIVPQDPVMFEGSVRTNLDPFKRFTDDEIWEVLKEVKMENSVGGSLEMRIDTSGENLSVGQKQLLCLARALLRRAHVICLDEVSANIDFETDAIIQQTLRDVFSYATVIVVAHRMNTIIHSDTIIVLDEGHCVETGSPSELLSRDSLFARIVNKLPTQQAALLRDIAIKGERHRFLPDTESLDWEEVVDEAVGEVAQQREQERDGDDDQRLSTEPAAEDTQLSHHTTSESSEDDAGGQGNDPY